MNLENKIKYLQNVIILFTFAMRLFYNRCGQPPARGPYQALELI